MRGQLQESADTWAGVVSDLGYTDDGDLADLDEWYDADGTDFRPLGEKVYESGAMAHRPE